MSESKNVEFRQLSDGYQGVQFRLVTVDWPDGSGDLLLILCSTVSSYLLDLLTINHQYKQCEINKMH